MKHGRHLKAKQDRRAAKELKNLKIYAGRVLRDLERKLSDANELMLWQVAQGA